MKKLILLLIGALFSAISFGQAKVKTNLYIEKPNPIIYLNGVSPIIDFYNGDIRIEGSSNKLTLVGGDFDAGANNLLLSGSVGSEAIPSLKGWFTNFNITNLPTINGVSIHASPVFTGNADFDSLTVAEKLIIPANGFIYGGMSITTRAEDLNNTYGTSGNLQNQINNKMDANNGIGTGQTTIYDLKLGNVHDSVPVIEAVTRPGGVYYGVVFKDETEPAPPYMPPGTIAPALDHVLMLNDTNSYAGSVTLTKLETYAQKKTTTYTDTVGVINQLGLIIFKTSDSHFYGCKSIGPTTWIQLDN